jgi:uncharacterized repeat protein (TIGR04052 family)
VTPTDFRFYVSDVTLLTATGDAVPLSLEQDGQWQFQTVALLDFEDASGSCNSNLGTPETRNQVIGTIPSGNYTGIRFKLGFGPELNHQDIAAASPPLDITPLWWIWRSGYKFTRIDLVTQTSTVGAPTDFDDPANGFSIHLGSVCQGAVAAARPDTCSNPNVADVILNGFDVTRNVVVADLAALVANTNLGFNTPNTALGCMSSPTDPECADILPNFGLPFPGKSSTKQVFFRVK